MKIKTFAGVEIADEHCQPVYDKEEDRMIHVRIQNANIEPVFFACPDVEEMNKIISDYVASHAPEYDFVGGIRGLGELQKRVDSGEMVAAFALYPVTMRQIIDIADTGNIMPPKTTWFEPKLRSGLVIHKLS